MEPGLYGEALWVMILGMGIVFAFLLLLVLLLYVSQWLFGRFSSPPPAPPSKPRDAPDPVLLAALTAAVHRYRSRQ